TLTAAADVLEALGYAVEIPPWPYPAIRPLIHYGFLGRARRQFERLIERLTPYAAASVPIVGVEPSTVAVLRDEAELFLAKDPRVDRLRSCSMLLSELLARRHAEELPSVGGACVFHGHCHQKAVLDADAARAVLAAMDVEVREPEPGCCGM